MAPTQDPVSQMAVPSAQNPQGADGKPEYSTPVQKQASELFPGVSKDDETKLVGLIANLRTGWMVDRMARIRTWMLSVFFERGTQWVDWDTTGNCWYDALAYARENGVLEDGETADLEKYTNPMTLMFKEVFVSNLTQALPISIVRPANADNAKDSRTAKAGTNVLLILDRKNKRRKLIRTAFEYLYTYGCYFCYTRPVLDGIANGYDTIDTFEDIEIQTPAQMKCMACGTATDVDKLDSPKAGLVPCPSCTTPMGKESYYAPGEGNRKSLRQTGSKKVPRASVMQSMHSPLEVDLNPAVSDWYKTELLSKLCEIGFGEALQMFPAFRERIQQGAPDSTSANANWEALQRLQGRTVTYGYGADIQQSRPTYGEHWLQPSAYAEGKDFEFADRMKKLFPEGVKVSLVGEVVVDIRPAVMRKEWSSGRLFESYGPYSPSIAERVVPFNQRFNAAMQVLDDWMQRASTGLNVLDASRLDKQKVRQRSLVAGNIFEIPMRINGEARPMSEVFAHYDLPMDPAAWNYPQMIFTFCGLMAGLPPQNFGAGTQDGVETAQGQQQMLGQAMQSMRPFWDNVKDERAAAAQNELYWVKKLMEIGALKQLVMVEEDRGAGWRNNMVDWHEMAGDIEVFPDEDQGLPTSPDELRKTYLLMFEALTAGNPAAQAWFRVPQNADQVISSMVPGSKSPNAAQVEKTQLDIQTLVSKPSIPAVGPNGEQIQKLPAEPNKDVDDFQLAKDTLQQYMLEECDMQNTNPDAWERLLAYKHLLDDGDMAAGIDKAQRQLKVSQASQSPKPGPDPSVMATVQELIGLSKNMADRLAQLAMIDPAATKNTANAQVSAAGKVIDATTDAAKILHK